MRAVCTSFLLLVLLALAITAVGTVGARTIGIMTTPPGSFTHSASSVIAKIIVEKTGLKATLQPAATRAYGAVDSGLADFKHGRLQRCGTRFSRGKSTRIKVRRETYHW